MSVKEVVDHCKNLYDDIDLKYVKQWKEKTGQKAVGFMPVYVPREIIHACKALPVGIMGAGSDLEIIKGDAYFQSYICHIPRSTIEMGLTGRLDSLDGMLFPAICDVIRNLSGMWKTLFKGKYVKYFDLPQNFDPSIGGEFYQHEIESLIEGISGITGHKPSTEDLNDSIKLYNTNRQAIERLYNMRAESPHMVTTYELYLIMRASNYLEVTEHTALIEDYLGRVIKEDRRKLDNIKVVVSGSFCEQPPLGLVKALESSGCYIVEDDWVLGARFIQGDVAITDNPVKAVSDAYLGDTVESASRYEPIRKKGSYLIDRVRKLGAEGVIFAGPSFCDPALLERPMLVDAMNEADIPHTSLKYAENSGQFRVFQEQTGTFADSIKLWGAE